MKGGIADAGDQYRGLDRFGRVIDQNWINTGTGASVDRYQYEYDRNSNVTEKNNLLQTAFDEAYTYDALNRLATSTDESFSMDALGNITTADGTRSMPGHQP